MKTFRFIAASLVVAMAASCTSGNGAGAKADGADSTKVVKPVDPKTLKPRKSEVDSVSYLIGVNFGTFLKGYNFGDVNFKLVEKGIRDFMKAKGDYRDSTYAKQFKINPEEMNELFNDFLSKRRDYTAALKKAEGAEFLAKNSRKDSVQVTESGLQYIIREAGNDVKPGPKDTVFVHYKGSLIDGTVFDESPKGGDGVQLTLNHVVAGWTEGLQLIGEGGKMKLFIPSDLGYGERGARGIDPNSTLIFDLELVKVAKYVEPVAEEEASK